MKNMFKLIIGLICDSLNQDCRETDKQLRPHYFSFYNTYLPMFSNHLALLTSLVLKFFLYVCILNLIEHI